MPENTAAVLIFALTVVSDGTVYAHPGLQLEMIEILFLNSASVVQASETTEVPGLPLMKMFAVVNLTRKVA